MLLLPATFDDAPNDIDEAAGAPTGAPIPPNGVLVPVVELEPNPPELETGNGVFGATSCEV